MDKNNIPMLPAGYPSRLDFAVETFDTRGVWVEKLLTEEPEIDHDAMREAARSELLALRTRAQVPEGQGL